MIKFLKSLFGFGSATPVAPATETAPYKVETSTLAVPTTPVIETVPAVAPLGDTTSGGGPAVDVATVAPAKKPRKPRTPKAEKPAVTKVPAKPRAPRKPKIQVTK